MTATSIFVTAPGSSGCGSTCVYQGAYSVDRMVRCPQPALGDHPRCRLSVLYSKARRLGRLIVELDHEVGVAIAGGGVENKLDRPRDFEIGREGRSGECQHPP